MCGRFTLAIPQEQLQLAFPWLSFPSDLSPRYNIAPTQPIAVVPGSEKPTVRLFRWGLIPFWAKDPKIGSRMINARSETLSEKSSFRDAYRRRRCLVLADGFFEWQKTPGQRAKTPFFIRLKSGEPFAFAGLWDRWHSPGGSEILSCAIITTRPNELLAPIHNRMPVILPSDSYRDWLDPAAQSPVQLQPYPAAEMTAYPVATLVNNPANDLPACTIPTIVQSPWCRAAEPSY
jgi:putative SOS response-associated peptidase YedK